MKTRASSLILLAVLGLLVSPAAIAASPEVPAKAFRISAIEQRDQAAVERGTTEFSVRRVLGEPHRKLNPDTWVYERYEACDWKINTADCSTLLVTFTNGKVEELKLVNKGAEKLIAARLNRSAAPAAVAAK